MKIFALILGLLPQIASSSNLYHQNSTGKDIAGPVALGVFLAPGVFKRITPSGYRIEVPSTEGLKNYREILAMEIEQITLSDVRSKNLRTMKTEQLMRIDLALSDRNKGTSQRSDTVGACNYSYNIQASALVGSPNITSSATATATQAPVLNGVYGYYVLYILDSSNNALSYDAAASGFPLDGSENLQGAISYANGQNGACQATAESYIAAYDNSGFCDDDYLFESASGC